MCNQSETKTSLFSRFGSIISLIISIISISIAIMVYLENRREGNINIFTPTRYGILRGTHQSNQSDKILLCFTVHNNGNLFRNISSINLLLEDEDGSKWKLKAIGKFNELKELNFQKYSLSLNPNYSLITSLSFDKNQFLTLNLLFYFENDLGWNASGEKFQISEKTYKGKIQLISTEVHDQINYKSVPYESRPFEFTIKYIPKINLIDTFTNIKQI
jgi:hypothetical protein